MKKYSLVGSTLTVCLLFGACQKVPPNNLLGTSASLQTSGGSFYDSLRLSRPIDTTRPRLDTGKPAAPIGPAVPITPAPSVPFPEIVAAEPPAPSCPLAPIYGGSIIYPQPANGADYVINPVNSPGQGKYFSWPQGMVIDMNTGAIDVTKSETGLKYAIGFVRNGSTDTCLSTLIIGGASYYDSIYVLNSGANTAVPYFDGDPYFLNKCAASPNACSFDVNGTAASKKIIVNPSTGVIDLQKTLNGSLLGLGGTFGLIPTNGQSVTATIYYQLNDASNNALQHIDVQMVYFDSKDNMNAGLLSGIVNAVDNLLAGHLISTTINPRPPLIVIVRRLH